MASSSDRYVRQMTVQDWISQGKSGHILHKLIEDKFGLKSSSARNKLIKEAAKEIWSDITPADLRHQYNTFLASIIGKAFDSNQLNTAIRAIAAGTKLNKLDTDIRDYSDDDYEIEF